MGGNKAGPHLDAAGTQFEYPVDISTGVNAAGSNHRDLPVYGLADDVAWLIFDQIFNSPRAVADYIELARLFHTVVISDIPYLTTDNEDKTRRFIQLMDEFYDRNVIVIISAVDTADQLYQGKSLSFEFERTVSRIEEMKSLHYLQKPHKA